MGKHAAPAGNTHPTEVELERVASLLESLGFKPLVRPDRLVVGECRGPEIRDMLTALNTGHEGGCGTVHANGVGEVPARLEALAALGGLGREALHAQLAAAFRQPALAQPALAQSALAQSAGG